MPSNLNEQEMNKYKETLLNPPDLTGPEDLIKAPDIKEWLILRDRRCGELYKITSRSQEQELELQLIELDIMKKHLTVAGGKLSESIEVSKILDEYKHRLLIDKDPSFTSSYLIAENKKRINTPGYNLALAQSYLSAPSSDKIWGTQTVPAATTSPVSTEEMVSNVEEQTTAENQTIDEMATYGMSGEDFDKYRNLYLAETIKPDDVDEWKRLRGIRYEFLKTNQPKGGDWKSELDALEVKTLFSPTSQGGLGFNSKSNIPTLVQQLGDHMASLKKKLLSEPDNKSLLAEHGCLEEMATRLKSNWLNILQTLENGKEDGYVDPYIVTPNPVLKKSSPLLPEATSDDKTAPQSPSTIIAQGSANVLDSMIVAYDRKYQDPSSLKYQQGTEKPVKENGQVTLKFPPGDEAKDFSIDRAKEGNAFLICDEHSNVIAYSKGDGRLLNMKGEEFVKGAGGPDYVASDTTRNTFIQNYGKQGTAAPESKVTMEELKKLEDEPQNLINEDGAMDNDDDDAMDNDEDDAMDNDEDDAMKRGWRF